MVFKMGSVVAHLEEPGELQGAEWGEQAASWAGPGQAS